MRKSYKAAMDRLTVSDGLRQRVLAAAEEKERSAPGFVSRRWVKPVCGAAACLALMGAAGVWMNLSGIDTANLVQKTASSSAAVSSTEAGFAETADSSPTESRKQNEAADEATMETCLTDEAGTAENDTEDTKGSGASSAAAFTTLPVSGDGENTLAGGASSQSDETDVGAENGDSGRMESVGSSDDPESSGESTSETGNGSGWEGDSFMISISNPVLSCETREAAAGLLGFSPLIPESIPPDAEISVIAGSLLQLCWERDGVSFVYRTAEGSDDISGDWNSYEISEIVDIAGRAVTLKGSGGMVSLMLWTENDQTFSLSADPGLEREKMEALAGMTE